MFITGKHLSRRAVLHALGASVALPFLESMLPAGAAAQRTAAAKPKTRLACLEMVHGSAGATRYGTDKNLWSPAAEGQEFDLSTTSLAPLEPFKDDLTIVSNTEMRAAEAASLPEVGGDHFRCSAVFLTQSHPKQTEGSDVFAGVSIDQLYAEKFGQDTPLPSIQLSIESVDQAGGCDYGYSCQYTDTISWSSPTKALPMVRDPRMVFDQLFGVGGTPEAREARRKADRSILDLVTHQIAQLKSAVGPGDRKKLDDYLESVREIERRIQAVEQRNASGEARQLPAAPAGVPDSWDEHVRLMFDLQALAFAADITRVSTFKMSRDANGRTFPESGITAGFHPASHHGENEQRIVQFAQINRYHVSTVTHFLKKLKSVDDGDGSLLDHTLVLYGSPMGDSNLHNHKRVPIFLAGHASGALKGHRHVVAPNTTPTANLYLTLLHKLGLDNIKAFGDSTGELSV